MLLLVVVRARTLLILCEPSWLLEIRLNGIELGSEHRIKLPWLAITRVLGRILTR